jgi:hypothetical protein
MFHIKYFTKGVARKMRFFFLIFAKVIVNETPIGLLLQIHTQSVLCILIPQLLKF